MTDQPDELSEVRAELQQEDLSIVEEDSLSANTTTDNEWADAQAPRPTDRAAGLRSAGGMGVSAEIRDQPREAEEAMTDGHLDAYNAIDEVPDPAPDPARGIARIQGLRQQVATRRPR